MKNVRHPFVLSHAYPREIGRLEVQESTRIIPHGWTSPSVKQIIEVNMIFGG